MFNRRAILTVALGAALAVPVAFMARADLIDQLDTDHSGSIELAEVSKAAAAKFDALDGDHSGSLERKELGARVTDADFKAADTDGSGSIGKPEFVALAEKLFKEADTGHDGSLSHDDLKTAAGQKLTNLLK